VLRWVREGLHASHADETREHEGAIERLQIEHKRLQNRLDAMYVDKLDGRVDASFYERMSTSWREGQTRCLREIEQHQAANKSYMGASPRPADCGIGPLGSPPFLGTIGGSALTILLALAFFSTEAFWR
jgi:hypothetical protein